MKSQGTVVSGLVHIDPAYAIARRQMHSFGPIVSFALADRRRVERFLASCQLVYGATNFGGIHTTAERRARWGDDAILAGFIQLSVGCEDGDDLLADLSQALDAASMG